MLGSESVRIATKRVPGCASLNLGVSGQEQCQHAAKVNGHTCVAVASARAHCMRSRQPLDST